MRVSLTHTLGEAWDHMVRVLFSPFDFMKWVVLGFAAWLAGLTAYTGNGNSGGWNFDYRVERDFDDFESLAQWIAGRWDTFFGNFWAMALAAFILISLLLILALLTWISSRGKFIFLDGVVCNEARIVEPWSRLRKHGDSLFLFRLILGLAQLPIALGLFGGLAWALMATFGYAVEPSFGLFPIYLSIALFFVIYAIASALIYFALDAFIVPIMYRLDLGVMDAWRYFWPRLEANMGSFIVCALFLFLASIAVGITILVIGFMTCCVGLILFALPYIGTVLFLPVLVTYRSFTVLFLGQIDSSLAMIERPVPAMPEVPLPRPFDPRD